MIARPAAQISHKFDNLLPFIHRNNSGKSLHVNI